LVFPDSRRRLVWRTVLWVYVGVFLLGIVRAASGADPGRTIGVLVFLIFLGVAGMASRDCVLGRAGKVRRRRPGAPRLRRRGATARSSPGQLHKAIVSQTNILLHIFADSSPPPGAGGRRRGK
jgi:hypothetical protein